MVTKVEEVVSPEKGIPEEVLKEAARHFVYGEDMVLKLMAAVGEFDPQKEDKRTAFIRYAWKISDPANRHESTGGEEDKKVLRLLTERIEASWPSDEVVQQRLADIGMSRFWPEISSN